MPLKNSWRFGSFQTKPGFSNRNLPCPEMGLAARERERERECERENGLKPFTTTLEKERTKDNDRERARERKGETVELGTIRFQGLGSGF